MKIFIATDHAGYELKKYLLEQLILDGHNVEDCGAYAYNSIDDYPDFIIPAAKKVANTPNAKGIILGGSGQGEAMAANRIFGVRAIVYYDGPIEIIKLSRLHNNANILSLGARFLSTQRAKEVVNIWLNENFEGGRHEDRINKLDI